MKPWIEEMYRALDTWDTNWIIARMHEEFVFIDGNNWVLTQL